MAEQQTEIFIDVQFKTEETAKGLSEVTALLAQLKAEQKALTKEIQAGNDVDGEKARQLVAISKEVQNLTAQQKALTGQLATTVQANNELGDSYTEMNALLRQLEQEYKGLTKAQRESAEGQQLKKAIIEQKQALKDFDAELGDHFRNVGNYPSVLNGLLPSFGNVDKAMAAMGVSLESLSKDGVKAFTGLGKSVKSFGKIFLTPPVAIVVTVLAAIMFAVDQLRKAFAKNDDASTKLAAAMAKLEPIGDLIGKIFIALADIVATLVDKMMQAYEWIIKMGNRLGLISDEFLQATQSASGLVKAIDNLEEAERRYTINSARRSKEVAQLRSDAMKSDDIDERINKLARAIELEKQNLAEQKSIAQQRLANLQEQAKKTGDTSNEMENKIAQATAAMYQAEEAYITGTQRLLKRLEEDKRAATAAIVEAGNEASELEAIYQRLVRMRDEFKEDGFNLVEDEDIEEADVKLTYVQELYAELMRQGYTYKEAQRQIARETAAIYADAASTIVGSMSNAFKALSDLSAAFGEENEAAMAASKAFAMVGILADEAQTISAGVRGVAEAVAAGAGIPFPFNIPAIASGVAAVTSTIAGVVAGITQAKQLLSEANQYAGGGIIAGKYDGKDDVPAMLSKGEMILNPAQQTRLFEMANGQAQMAGNYDMMRAAMSQALQDMPAPVMVYNEFEQFSQRVATYKEIARV